MDNVTYLSASLSLTQHTTAPIPLPPRRRRKDPPSQSPPPARCCCLMSPQLNSYPPESAAALRVPWRAPQRLPEWMANARPLLACGWRRPWMAPCRARLEAVPGRDLLLRAVPPYQRRPGPSRARRGGNCMVPPHGLSGYKEGAAIALRRAPQRPPPPP